ncbi:MAG: Rrf2 family transcriptional regulator [Candidatus Wallbacteria bacterium]|nr:Rrf2 family transcriptional regulator [Candidatus Wallbacteria bacterium]
MTKVFNLTEAVFLGSHCCALLGSSDRRMSAKELAEGTSSSEHHINKVMRRLHRAGIVDSTRGPSGGYEMAAGSADKTLLELYEILEGPVRGEACPFGRNKCPFDYCRLGNQIRRISVEFTEFLRHTTLGNLSENKGGDC